MKLPKIIIVGGQEWTIKENKKMHGGRFYGNKRLLEIGTKDPKDVPSILLHEVIESILSERDCRYDQYGGMDGNENFLFNFDHKQFIQVVKDIALALKDIKDFS
uniref:Peptidase n=1 Tax=viral metagenome TaxID=1070528 RepID=A0A6M3JI48_9ZZZZ